MEEEERASEREREIRKRTILETKGHTPIFSDSGNDNS